MGKLKGWERSKEIKRTPSSVDGLEYEITGTAKGASKITKGIRKASIVRISKDGQKKVPALSHLTPIHFATGATSISPHTPPNTTNGKLNERDKMSSPRSYSQATPIKRKTEFQKLFIGLKLLKIKRFSVVDLVIIVILAKVFVFVATHLHLKITWG